MEYRKPTPTEYRGIIFRSKSEAVFARALDIANERKYWPLAGHSWLYEPGVHQTHDWDFECVSYWMKHCEHCNSHYQSAVMNLIEYKPSMPTMTYVRNLTEKVRERLAKCTSHTMNSYIVWGNPWDGITEESSDLVLNCCYVTYPIFSRYDNKFGWGDFEPLADSGNDAPYSLRHRTQEIFGITEEIAQEAREFRFDLIH